jgi:putative chitinase
MVTAEQLQSIMPRLRPERNAEFLPFLTAAMTEFAIDPPARAAAFLAQLAHESGQFRFMEEIWGPTPAQKRYEPVTTLSAALGNTNVGDGKLFKGRGPIQLTGRANYKRFGDLLTVDLVADPPRAATPDVAFRVAGLFWSRKGLNELADAATADSFREITRRINGGFNGLAERQAFYATAREVLGVTVVAGPSISSRGVGAPSAEEPMFDRGAEAIRTHARRRRPAKGPAKPKRKSAKNKTKMRTARPRRATKRTPTPSKRRR